jgi:hypothetical protein
VLNKARPPWLHLPSVQPFPIHVVVLLVLFIDSELAGLVRSFAQVVEILSLIATAGN